VLSLLCHRREAQNFVWSCRKSTVVHQERSHIAYRIGSKSTPVVWALMIASSSEKTPDIATSLDTQGTKDFRDHLRKMWEGP
jgi:hypothetical protein